MTLMSEIVKLLVNMEVTLPLTEDEVSDILRAYIDIIESTDAAML